MFNTHADIQPDTSYSMPRPSVVIGRVTALWAFGEAAFGGVLHALRIPFTGLWIGGAAVIFISLIAWYSHEKSAILKATIIVILVKGIVSPHTPLTAHLAVFLQGCTGYLLFSLIKNYSVSAMMLALISMLLSSVQKIVLTTIIFGFTLWESIDRFSLFVLEQFSINTSSLQSFSFSGVLIGVYILLHIAGGIIAGIIAMRIPRLITAQIIKENNRDADDCSENKKLIFDKQKKKPVWKRRLSSVIVIFALVMLVLSYFTPAFGEGAAYDITIMLIRYALIMLCWYLVIAPILLRVIRKLFQKKKLKYSVEIEEVLGLLPEMREAFRISWCRSENVKGLKRIRLFLTMMLALILIKGAE